MSHYRNLKGFKLAFVGTANWDIYGNNDGKLIALAKPGNSAADSHYGDIHHVKRLMANDWFTYESITDHGLELLAGLNSRILPNGGSFLSFH